MKNALLLLLALLAPQEKDLEPGLVAEYFAGGGGDGYAAASQKPSRDTSTLSTSSLV